MNMKNKIIGLAMLFLLIFSTTSTAMIDLTGGRGTSTVAGNPFDQNLNTGDNPQFTGLDLTDDLDMQNNDINNINNVNATALFGDGGNLTNVSCSGSGASLTNLNASNITTGFYNPFDQDLNTTDAPTFDDLAVTDRLDVGGDIVAVDDIMCDVTYQRSIVMDDSIIHSGDADTTIHFNNDEIYLKVGGTILLNLLPELFTIAGNTTIEYDLEVANNCNASAFHGDGGNLTNISSSFTYSDWFNQNINTTNNVTFTFLDIVYGINASYFKGDGGNLTNISYSHSHPFNYSGYNQGLNTTDAVSFVNVTSVFIGDGGNLTNISYSHTHPFNYSGYNQNLNTTNNVTFTYIDIAYDANVSGNLTVADNITGNAFYGDGGNLTNISSSWTYSDYFNQYLNTTNNATFTYLDVDNGINASWFAGDGGNLTNVTNYENTVTVAISGGDYTTIQSALDDNGANTLFLVYPGTYTDDTINFTANNQYVRGVSHNPSSVKLTTADKEIINCSFTSCKVGFIKATVTAATTHKDTVAVSGNLALYRCHIGMTCANGFAGFQPGCLEASGTVKMVQGTLEYTHTGAQAGIVKQAVHLDTGCFIDLVQVNIDIVGSGASTGTTIAYGTSTGDINVTESNGEVYDPDTNFVVGFYAGGAGYHEFYYNTLHVEGSGNNAYGVYIVGTPTIRGMFNHIHIDCPGGTAKSYVIGAGATVTSQFEDIIAANGYTNSGTFNYVSSFSDCNFNVSCTVNAGAFKGDGGNLTNITGVGSNPFNQDLNTTDNATFTYLDITYDANITGNLTAGALYGDGGNLTNISTDNPFNQDLNTTDNATFTYLDVTYDENVSGNLTVDGEIIVSNNIEIWGNYYLKWLDNAGVNTYAYILANTDELRISATDNNPTNFRYGSLGSDISATINGTTGNWNFTENISVDNNVYGGAFHGDGGNLTNITGVGSNPFNQDLNTTDNATFNNLSVNNFSTPYNNTVTIAKSGGDYTSIQTALDDNPVESTLFLVYPGVYTDTIHFTANKQTVIATGHAQNTKVRQIDANVVNASNYQNCLIKYLHIQLWEPDSDIDMISVGDGSVSVLSTKLTLNTSTNIAGASQPHIAHVYGNGLYKSKLGEVQYFHSGDTGNGIKSVFDVSGVDGEIQFLRSCKMNVSNSGTATATTISISDSTGSFETDYMCDARVTDPDATIVAGFGYLGGSGENIITHSAIIVTGGGANNCYAVYLSGTGTLRSAHNNVLIQGGANNYGIYVGANAEFYGHMDDIRASSGDQSLGTVGIASSLADGNFTASGNITAGAFHGDGGNLTNITGSFNYSDWFNQNLNTTDNVTHTFIDATYGINASYFSGDGGNLTNISEAINGSSLDLENISVNNISEYTLGHDVHFLNNATFENITVPNKIYLDSEHQQSIYGDTINDSIRIRLNESKWTGLGIDVANCFGAFEGVVLFGTDKAPAVPSYEVKTAVGLINGFKILTADTTDCGFEFQNYTVSDTYGGGVNLGSVNMRYWVPDGSWNMHFENMRGGVNFTFAPWVHAEEDFIVSGDANLSYLNVTNYANITGTLNMTGHDITEANLSEYAGANITWDGVTGTFNATGGGGGGDSYWSRVGTTLYPETNYDEVKVNETITAYNVSIYKPGQDGTLSTNNNNATSGLDVGIPDSNETCSGFFVGGATGDPGVYFLNDYDLGGHITMGQWDAGFDADRFLFHKFGVMFGAGTAGDATHTANPALNDKMFYDASENELQITSGTYAVTLDGDDGSGVFTGDVEIRDELEVWKDCNFTRVNITNTSLMYDSPPILNSTSTVDATGAGFVQPDVNPNIINVNITGGGLDALGEVAGLKINYDSQSSTYLLETNEAGLSVDAKVSSDTYSTASGVRVITDSDGTSGTGIYAKLTADGAGVNQYFQAGPMGLYSQGSSRVDTAADALGIYGYGYVANTSTGNHTAIGFFGYGNAQGDAYECGVEGAAYDTQVSGTSGQKQWGLFSLGNLGVSYGSLYLSDYSTLTAAERTPYGLVKYTSPDYVPFGSKGCLYVANISEFDGPVYMEDNLTVNGTLNMSGLVFNGNITPAANDTYDLGAPGNCWNTTYTQNISSCSPLYIKSAGTTSIQVEDDRVLFTPDSYFLSTDAYFAQDLTHNGDTDTYIRFTPDNVDVYSGGIHNLEMDATNTIVNNIFQAMGDHGHINIYSDSANDFVGFGDSHPDQAVDVSGGVNCTYLNVTEDAIIEDDLTVHDKLYIDQAADNVSNPLFRIDGSFDAATCQAMYFNVDHWRDTGGITLVCDGYVRDKTQNSSFIYNVRSNIYEAFQQLKGTKYHYGFFNNFPTGAGLGGTLKKFGLYNDFNGVNHLNSKQTIEEYGTYTDFGNNFVFNTTGSPCSNLSAYGHYIADGALTRFGNIDGNYNLTGIYIEDLEADSDWDNVEAIHVEGGETYLGGNVTIEESKSLTWSSYCSVTTEANGNAAQQFNVFDTDNYAAYSYTNNVEQNGIDYDSSTGNFTFNNSGVYQITFNSITMVSATDEYAINITNNGASIYNHFHSIHTALDPPERSITMIYEFSEGDELQVFVQNTDGVDTLAARSGTTLSIYRIS